MKRLAAKEDEVKQLMDAMTELAEQNTELQQRAEAAESGIKVPCTLRESHHPLLSSAALPPRGSSASSPAPQLRPLRRAPR